MVSPASAYLTQTLAGRFQLVGHVADGNFSHVFKAVDQRHNAVVAVKMLRPDAVCTQSQLSSSSTRASCSRSWSRVRE